MSLWEWFLLVYFVLSVAFILWNLYKDDQDKKKVANNSVVFHPQFTPVWKAAAQDWIMDDGDTRDYEDFFTDTADLIIKKIRG